MIVNENTNFNCKSFSESFLTAKLGHGSLWQLRDDQAQQEDATNIPLTFRAQFYGQKSWKKLSDSKAVDMAERLIPEMTIKYMQEMDSGCLKLLSRALFWVTFTRSGKFERFFSAIAHAFRGQGFISTAAKARKLRDQIKTIYEKTAVTAPQTPILSHEPKKESEVKIAQSTKILPKVEKDTKEEDAFEGLDAYLASKAQEHAKEKAIGALLTEQHPTIVGAIALFTSLVNPQKVTVEKNSKTGETVCQIHLKGARKIALKLIPSSEKKVKKVRSADLHIKNVVTLTFKKDKTLKIKGIKATVHSKNIPYLLVNTNVKLKSIQYYPGTPQPIMCGSTLITTIAALNRMTVNLAAPFGVPATQSCTWSSKPKGFASIIAALNLFAQPKEGGSFPYKNGALSVSPSTNGKREFSMPYKKRTIQATLS